MNVYFEGDRVRLDTCPVNLFSQDIVSLLRSINLADGRLSVQEQDSLPGVYVDAWAYARSNQTELRNSKLHEAK